MLCLHSKRGQTYLNAMKQKTSIWFIFVTILLDAVGIGLLIPVMPDIIKRFTTDTTLVSQYFGYFIASYAFMQFLASPILGSLSDRFGRRPILLISLLGSGIDYLFMAFASTLPLLFLGRIISGATGASATVASSYMADISDDKNRSANFGMIGAAWGLGFIFGPILGGLASSISATTPFLIAAGLNILNFLFGLFILPESLPENLRRKVSMASLNPFKSILKILKPSPIMILIYAYFLLYLAANVHPVNWTLYTENKFGWSSWQVGLSLSFVGIMIAISQGFLTRIIIPKLGEYKSLKLGISIEAISFLLFAAASQGWMMYPIVVFSALAGIAQPALQSIVTKNVPANEQGELQGSLVALGSVSSIISPLIFTYLFVKFTDTSKSFQFPGAAYIGASVISLMALILILNIKKQKDLT
jgi:MFS transporter, DHA1 family, tetracycline resistance protein